MAATGPPETFDEIAADFGGFFRLREAIDNLRLRADWNVAAH